MKKLFFLLLTVATFTIASAQSRTVTGKVVYAGDDEPMVGASIMPIGGGTGTSTNIEGEFSLKVNDNVKKLKVTYVGMHTVEVEITGKPLLIKMTSADIKIDEVMVVAYGTATKSAFTGSAAVVDASQIEKAQVSNALNAITGKVAGVQLTNTSGQPGQTTPTIRIRGISSLNAGNSPLVIVNGAPFSGDINTINTNDIESMTVLKDAASNALYGARGANGVILITTKKGQLGSGAVVNVDMKWGANTRATQDYDYIKDPRQYYELYYKSLYNYAVNHDGLTPDAAHVWANQNMTASNDYGLAYQTYTAPNGQYLVGRNGKFNPEATPGYLKTYKGTEYMLTPDNWLENSYKNSLRQEYNVSVTNGTDQTSFFMSAGYLNNEGITPNSGYERFTGRLTADTQAKSWLKVGADLSYTHYSAKMMSSEGASNSSGNIFAAATEVAPIYPLFIRDAAGKVMVDANGITRYDYGDGENAGLKRPVFQESNAISGALLDVNKNNGNAFTGTGFFEVRFLKDFKFTSNNTVNIDERRYTNLANPYYGGYATSNGIITKEHYRRMNYTFQQLLNWNRKFGLHEVTALLGHENYWSKIADLSASRSNMFDPSNLELDGAVTDGSSGSYTSSYNNEGWLFRGQYNYDNKYFASASFRRDASSRFHPDHRWGNFWSAGGAWIISKESWFNAPWVDMLKIKASYGEQGNDNISDYLYVNTYNIVNGSGSPAATPATLGNPDISWEKNGNFNAGVEFDLFNSRLGGSIEGFWRKTTDMLSWFTLPPSFGYTGYWDNIGDMTNAGVEIDLNATIINTKDITWSVNANLTWYKNTLSYLPEERKTMTRDGVSGYQSGSYFYGEGIPLYTYHLRRYAGVDPETGDARYWHKVTDADKTANRYEGIAVGDLAAVTYDGLTSQDYFLCGSALPTTYGGFGTSVRAYGFDLSLDFGYSLGGQVYDGQYALYMTSPTSTQRGYNFHADILKAWSPENPTSNIPRLQYGDQYVATSSDRFLTSANYLSLQNINFGYTLPQNIVRKMFLSKLRVYLSCDNVWLWAKRQGIDPRQSISGSVNNTYYAPIRTISGGLSVSF